MQYDLVPLGTGAGLGLLDGALREVSYFQSRPEAVALTRLGIFGAALTVELTGIMNSEIPATVIAVEAALLASGVPAMVNKRGYLKGSVASGDIGQQQMQVTPEYQPNASGEVVNPYGLGVGQAIGSDYQMTDTQASPIGGLAHGLVPIPTLQPGTEIIPYGQHQNLSYHDHTQSPSAAGQWGPRSLAVVAPGGSPAAWGTFGPQRKQQAPSLVG